MGFFGLWKKKSDLPNLQKPDSGNMDLPNIDGRNLDSGMSLDVDGPDMQLPEIAEGNNMPGMDGAPNQLQNPNSNPNLNIPGRVQYGQNATPPAFDESQSQPSLDATYIPQLDGGNDNSMTLDDSMTIPDSEIMEPAAPGTNRQDSGLSGNNLSLQLDQSDSQMNMPSGNLGTSFNEDDVNHLFISDEWKTPDWSNYDPYSEEKIDEPTVQDFGMSAPSFSDAQDEAPQMDFSSPNFDVTAPAFSMQMPLASSNSNNGSSFSDDSNDRIAAPASPIKQRPASNKPVELYIKGKAYAKVFMELDHMNGVLSRIDSKLGNYEDILKREEPLVATARDQMEFIYKRINAVDKKVFDN